MFGEGLEQLLVPVMDPNDDFIQRAMSAPPMAEHVSQLVAPGMRCVIWLPGAAGYA